MNNKRKMKKKIKIKIKLRKKKKKAGHGKTTYYLMKNNIRNNKFLIRNHVHQMEKSHIFK
jgi:hypothetical protein